MSIWSRIRNVFRGDRLTREIDEELQTHIDEGIADGCDPDEARRALGPALQYREASRDARLVPWLESLRSDTVFGLRQLKKTPVTSAAAILSLALAAGACTTAFRLVDALLLRPLPVSEPDRLYAAVRSGISPDGQMRTSESFSHPIFRQMRAAVKGSAELIAVSRGVRTDITYGSDQEMEKAYRQYVSGWMFESLGVRPSIGRVLTEQDDIKPGAHPYAVLSHDYWQRRFAGDPGVVGRAFRMGNDIFEIVGVAAEGFTGTEPGTFVDVFLPTMMNGTSVTSQNAFWIRVFLRPASSSVPIEPLAHKMDAVHRAMETERRKGLINIPKRVLAAAATERVGLQRATAGLSAMQTNYRLSLTVLGILVMLVLLIACVNIANLMTARAAARMRELALRVSIGAGRARLVQLVVVESALLALLATAAGTLFAWWSAPFVVGLINPPDNPARLHLPFDWRLACFTVALVFAATLLFGLAPALRASAVTPASALKGGDDPHAHRRLMKALIGVQVAFCVVVLILGRLFIATHQKLVSQPTGYSSERLLALETVTAKPVPAAYWQQVAEHLRSLRGVTDVAYSEWPLMSGEMWNSFLSINGGPPTTTPTFLLPVSPGWVNTMKIGLVSGRDFRPEDTQPGAAIVNQAFARQHFGGQDPVGRYFEIPQPGSAPQRYAIVGMARDARYNDMRTPIFPVAYLPARSVNAKSEPQLRHRAAYMVRLDASDATAVAAALRQEVAKARAEFRVSNIRTQKEIDEAHTVRERLLAMLALFFSITALVLAAVGLYGVLDYSVIQRRREIGIRIAIGARAANLAGRLTVDAVLVVTAGAAVGVAAGIAAERYVRTLLFGVKATDAAMLAWPVLIITLVALLASVPAIVRALRINPAVLLRAD